MLLSKLLRSLVELEKQLASVIQKQAVAENPKQS